jgi:hypothetical protein
MRWMTSSAPTGDGGAVVDDDERAIDLIRRLQGRPEAFFAELDLR